MLMQVHMLRNPYSNREITIQMVVNISIICEIDLSKIYKYRIQNMRDKNFPMWRDDVNWSSIARFDRLCLLYKNSTQGLSKSQVDLRIFELQCKERK